MKKRCSLYLVMLLVLSILLPGPAAWAKHSCELTGVADIVDGYIAPTETEPGYFGDLYCMCGELIERGFVIDSLEVARQKVNAEKQATAEAAEREAAEREVAEQAAAEAAEREAAERAAAEKAAVKAGRNRHTGRTIVHPLPIKSKIR